MHPEVSYYQMVTDAGSTSSTCVLPYIIRVRVNRFGWPRGGIVMRGDHLGEYWEKIFCHPFKPLALLLRQRTRKQDNKQLIITTVRVTADSG